MKHNKIIKNEQGSTAVPYSWLESACLEKGLRMTYARGIILTIMKQASSYLTVEDVYRGVINTNNKISASTIYNNIKVLVDSDLVARRRVKSKLRYYLKGRDMPQDQLIDMESGQVVQFHNESLDKLKEDIVRKFGFSLEGCHVEIYSHKLAATVDD